MNRRALFIAIAVIGLIGAVGAAAVAVKWFTRDRVAMGTYRMQGAPGMSFQEAIDAERELMVSESMLKPIIADLDLVNRWKLNTEEEALAHMREKLKMFEGQTPGMVRVIYRDKKQDRAMEVLQAINKSYVEVKRSQGALLSRPPGP